MENSKQKGKFQSNFGFLMAAIGSAVGLGNLWGFPYKMGNGGGFAFLFLYLILAVCIGYSCMLAEFAIGRKSGKGAIGAYEHIGRKFMFNGWIATMAPFFLMMFYLCLGGYCIKYLVANFGDIFGASWGVGDVASGDFFNTFVADPVQAVGFTLIFAVLTIVIVMGGVANGLERFSVIAMPALFVMLLITVIRSVTLPGAAEGLAFMFKPNFEVFKGWGWLKVLASAGGQLFFSLSLASSALIAYSSYLDKKENLEKNALIVPAADTTVAILCGLATLPAVFAAGLEPTQGPGMLFVTLQTVFQSMSGAGPIFGTIFYLLVFLAALTSSISMLEGSVSSFMDRRLEKGKSHGRTFLCLTIGGISTAGTVLVALDALGAAGLPHLFGFSTWLDTFDLFSEGILMPGGCLIMTIILGWIRPGYIDDEIKLSGSYRSKPFVEICLKFLAPVFLAFIVVVQMDGFFKLGLF
jgi:NSS family neurotransmitter:Na+ symporter